MGFTSENGGFIALKTKIPSVFQGFHEHEGMFFYVENSGL